VCVCVCVLSLLCFELLKSCSIADGTASVTGLTGHMAFYLQVFETGSRLQSAAICNISSTEEVCGQNVEFCNIERGGTQSNKWGAEG
jgi:hypothetical protein